MSFRVITVGSVSEPQQDFDDGATYKVIEGGALQVMTADGHLKTYSPTYWVAVDDNNPQQSVGIVAL